MIEARQSDGTGGNARRSDSEASENRHARRVAVILEESIIPPGAIPMVISW